MPRRALLVDPNPNRLGLLRSEINQFVDVEDCTDFPSARACLLQTSPDFLISNLRLGAYNGLHLAHLAGLARLQTRSLLYDEPTDPHLAFEVRLIGAFYETTSRLRLALPAFVQAPLPDWDRRDSHHVDRRRLFRGGRRATDLALGRIRRSSFERLH